MHVEDREQFSSEERDAAQESEVEGHAAQDAEPEEDVEGHVFKDDQVSEGQAQDA